ncbi:hypothetical protein JCM1841_006790 [Sporobolomyces salmonicolor]
MEETQQLPKFALVLLWITTSALQFGFHISALNSSAASIVCGTAVKQRGALGLPSCVELSETAFGLITSAYTVGGLFASLNTGGLIERWGKKGTAVVSAGVIILGASAVSLGSSLWVLVLGRILIGMSCGIATVLVPLYLASVAPPAIAGNLGILTQISVNVGIFIAQSISVPLSAPGTGQWRFVSLVSVAIAFAQIATSPLMVEERSDKTPTRVFVAPDEERTPLARDEDDEVASLKTDNGISLTVAEVLTSKEPSVKRPLWALVLVMFFQQAAGINAVMFYSVTILTAVNPASAKTVALLVTLINLLMTLPTVYLIDRLGRRSLLVISLITMSISSLVLGWAINTDQFTIASVFIILFVVSFAMGLGPVPFVLLGELPKPEAKSATASIAVAINWISNLIIGVAFLPFRDWLAGWTGTGSGSVFFVFAALSAVGAGVIGRVLR